ncbi:MAG: Ig-like domain-containing protein, partial [Defluviitaleaceae bacterium]|nr:Ig-like domain-containing protein [Defluviitaleaceae bacterium]
MKKITRLSKKLAALIVAAAMVITVVPAFAAASPGAAAGKGAPAARQFSGAAPMSGDAFDGGAYAMKMDGSGTGDGINFYFGWNQADRCVTVGMWVRGHGSFTAGVAFGWDGTNTHDAPVSVDSDVWQYKTLEFDYSHGNSDGYVYILDTAGGGTVYADNITYTVDGGADSLFSGYYTQGVADFETCVIDGGDGYPWVSPNTAGIFSVVTQASIDGGAGGGASQNMLALPTAGGSTNDGHIYLSGNQAGDQYELSFWIRGDITPDFGIGDQWGGGGVSQTITYPTDGAWHYMTIPITGMTTGSDSLRFMFETYWDTKTSGGAAGTAYITDVSITRIRGGVTSDNLVADPYFENGLSDDPWGTWAAGLVTVVPLAPALPAVGDVSVTGVTLDKNTASVAVGKTVTLTATVAPSDATNKAVAWSSGNEAVATVANGVVTGVSAGTAAITATTADGGFTADCAVTVTNSTGGGNINMLQYAGTGSWQWLGQTLDTPLATGSQYELGMWVRGNSAANITVAMIDNWNWDVQYFGGAITPTPSSGWQYVTFTTDVLTDAEAQAGVNPFLLFFDDNSATAGTVDITGVNLRVLDSQGNPSGKNLVNDPYFMGDGTADGYPHWDGANWYGQWGTNNGSPPKIQMIPIGSPLPYSTVTGVTLSQAAASMTVGDAPLQLTASVVPADAENAAYSWISSDPSVATVDVSGNVTAVAKGTATISAVSDELGFYADCAVTVSDGTGAP